MKLGVITMVRNEADIVHAFLDHLSAFFDVAFLLDHRSADGTERLMQRAVAGRNGWHYARLDFSGYHQKEVSNLFLKKAFEEHAVDFLFFLDADEFLSVPTRTELVDLLSRTVPRGTVGTCSWHNCCPADLARAKFCLGDEVWVAPKPSIYGKVVIPKETYAAFGGRLRVNQGNHGIDPLDAPGVSVVPLGKLLHVPVRSFQQMARKVVVGGLSYLAKATALSNDGFHWFQFLDQIAQGKVDQGSLIRLSVNYGEPLSAGGPRSFEELRKLGFQCRPFQVARADTGLAAEPLGDASELQVIASSLREWSNEDSRIVKLVLDGKEVRLMPTVAKLPPFYAPAKAIDALPAMQRPNLPESPVASPSGSATEDRTNAVLEGAEFDVFLETAHFMSAASSLPLEEERLRSAWTAHIPLMHCLIRYMRPRRFVELGTDRGTSFFSACHTVRDVGANTECIAVDNWRGDEHQDKYWKSTDEVFHEFKRRLDASYADFASFIRANFAEAVGSFADGSIDLLHIDGYHTYDAVKSDFESWLPKMSDVGVILLHDTCVRSGTFGVYFLLDELSKRYPCVNMAHDHGLAVVAVGKTETRVQKLVKAWSVNQGLAAMVVEFFKCAGFFSSQHGELAYHAESAECELARIRGSKSWRLTRPLRGIGRLMHRVA